MPRPVGANLPTCGLDVDLARQSLAWSSVGALVRTWARTRTSARSQPLMEMPPFWLRVHGNHAARGDGLLAHFTEMGAFTVAVVVVAIERCLGLGGRQGRHTQQEREGYSQVLHMSLDSPPRRRLAGIDYDLGIEAGWRLPESGRSALARIEHASVLRRLAIFLLASLAQAADHRLKASPETIVWGYYSAAAKPVLRIKSGDTVTIDTMITSSPERLAAAGVKPEQVEPELRAIYDKVKDKGPGGHILTGPIYVEGAEPGDVLEVRILKISPKIPYAYNGFAPGPRLPAGGVSRPPARSSSRST